MLKSLERNDASLVKLNNAFLVRETSTLIVLNRLTPRVFNKIQQRHKNSSAIKFNDIDVRLTCIFFHSRRNERTCRGKQRRSNRKYAVGKLLILRGFEKSYFYYRNSDIFILRP